VRAAGVDPSNRGLLGALGQSIGLGSTGDPILPR
jgi:hypothetical protein